MDSNTSAIAAAGLILCLITVYAKNKYNAPLRGTTAIVMEVGGCDRSGTCRVHVLESGQECTTTRVSEDYMEGSDYRHMPIEGEQVCVVGE